MVGLAIALAVAAAVCNGVGDVFQRSSARHERSDPSRGIGMVARLARQPRWLLGVLISVIGLGAHLTALTLGELAVVQPVLAGELPVAVLGSAWAFTVRLTTRDWVAVALLTGGLACFVYFLAPRGGDRLGVPGGTWVIAVAALVGAGVALIGAGWRARGDLRAGLFGVAAGLGYGMTATAFAVAGAIAAVDPGRLALSWPPYLAAAAGVVSFVVLQNAMAAGRLVAVEPGVTLANPVVAVVLAVVVFGEIPAPGLGPHLGAIGGAVALVVGVLLLATSPVLATEGRSADHSAHCRNY